MHNWFYYPYTDDSGNEAGCYIYGQYLSSSSPESGSSSSGGVTTSYYWCISPSNISNCDALKSEYEEKGYSVDVDVGFPGEFSNQYPQCAAVDLDTDAVLFKCSDS